LGKGRETSLASVVIMGKQDNDELPREKKWTDQGTGQRAGGINGGFDSGNTTPARPRSVPPFIN